MMVDSSSPLMLPRSKTSPQGRVDSAWDTLQVVSLGLLGLYFTAMAVQLSYFTPGGRTDDAEALFLTQSFEWGYEGKNPPLFYWLTTLLFQPLGPRVEAIFGLRMGLLFLMLWGSIALARRIQPDPALALAAGLSPLAFLQLHWYAISDLTHTAITGALFPWTLVALIALDERPTAPRYVALGACIGLGLLAKYTFVLFAGAMLIAVLRRPRLRRLFQAPGAILAFLVPVALGLPHGVWMLQNLGGIARQMDRSLGLEVGGSYAEGMVQGLLALLGSAGTVLAIPFGLLVLAFFGRGLRSGPPADSPRADYLAVTRDVLVMLFLSLLAYVLAGASRIEPHHLFFLVLLPAWLIGRMDAQAIRATRVRGYVVVVAAITVGSLLLFGPRAWNKARKIECGRCSEFLPYADYAATLQTAGFRGGTLVSLSSRRYLPGSLLRPHLPGTRFVSPEFGLYDPPRRNDGGDCAVLLSALDEKTLGARLRAGEPVPAIGLPLPEDARWVRAGGRFHLSDRMTPEALFVLIRGGLGDCH